ncbi:uncharacterized protein K460DRAFT_357487 [Cucurbitaria berberidis CBS 394.84]|uniref:Polynucleotide 5'-hydroxyl-kinase GRC3 n=1 Tax=Cucurbitaria berberidis CBS 394.84 TaxID=1168544 RepID=A0A9P4GEM5_9PLEO|nr:uncharacterized protein K460DRAFT_357487 [Cucurbitaria berberidis CBS 394.84]KAF1843805.1 hypothetical protein K460DRAFT_357487 [Cucurbitaria berberidis CBS 394.84]
MSGKRKRDEGTSSGTVAGRKPLSAIAAARLRAGAAAEGSTTPEITHEPVLAPSSLPPESPESGSGYGEPELGNKEEGEEEEETHAIIKRNFKLCNWRNESQNILSDTESELTINLNKHTTIALIGCFEFKVIRGAININGANIGALSRDAQKGVVHRAFVPSTHPILKIRGLDGTNHVQFMSCKEAVPIAENSPLFANIWNAEFVTRSFSIITESDADPLSRILTPEVTPEGWIRAIEDCTSTSSITLVTGSPNSGKSTFAGRLLNRYLTGFGKTARPVPAVYYLDLDPGKPEYTTSGQISLVLVRDIKLSPRFAHPATVSDIASSKADEVIRAHPIPTNLTNYADYYHTCIEDLFLSYRTLASRDTSLPLIINTPGFLYASRFDMLNKLLLRFKPHNIIHLGNTQATDTETATKMNSLQTISSHYRSTIHEIIAQPPLSIPARTDVEMNAMHMQSYFHINTTSTKPGKPRKLSWAPEPLSHLVPWEFCYQETIERSQDIVGFTMYTEPIEPTSLMTTLNGSIIQIVQSNSSTIPSPYTDLPRSSGHGIPYFPKSECTGMVEPLDPRTSKLICTAMIRGFDPDKKVVQVLVPKTQEALFYNLSPERTVFVGGCCDIPEWAYLEDTPGTKGVDQFAASSLEIEPKDGPLWVEKESTMEDMGYLNTVRRVRKFQT